MIKNNILPQFSPDHPWDHNKTIEFIAFVNDPVNRVGELNLDVVPLYKDFDSLIAIYDRIINNATKNDIITKLKPYNVASVRPEIVDPETTSLVLTVNAKYDKKGTAKTSILASFHEETRKRHN